MLGPQEQMELEIVMTIKLSANFTFSRDKMIHSLIYYLFFSLSSMYFTNGQAPWQVLDVSNYEPVFTLAILN